MPLVFYNNKQGLSMYSEVELTLDAVRDWTEEGVAEAAPGQEQPYYPTRFDD